MKTAVIYARYSSASQTEQSIEGQLHVCNQFAKANDLIVVDTYIDRAMTGTNDNRAAFQRMLADSASATWEVVLVYAIDRFGRNSVEVALNKQRLKSNNKILISATQRTSENLDGKTWTARKTWTASCSKTFISELRNIIRRSFRKRYAEA